MDFLFSKLSTGRTGWKAGDQLTWGKEIQIFWSFHWKSTTRRRFRHVNHCHYLTSLFSHIDRFLGWLSQLFHMDPGDRHMLRASCTHPTLSERETQGWLWSIRSIPLFLAAKITTWNSMKRSHQGLLRHHHLKTCWGGFPIWCTWVWASMDPIRMGISSQLPEWWCLNSNRSTFFLEPQFQGWIK